MPFFHSKLSFDEILYLDYIFVKTKIKPKLIKYGSIESLGKSLNKIFTGLILNSKVCDVESDTFGNTFFQN